MIDLNEPHPNPDLQSRIKEILDRGEAYADALSTIDPRLLIVDPNDLAAGFDIGSGADGIAFAKLKFKKAITTNNRNPLYDLAFQKNARLEDQVASEVWRYFPEHTYGSSLSTDEWINRPNFCPRLITMLRIAPNYFSGEDGDPAAFIKRFIQIHNRLKPNSLVVLSALNDHESSGQVFTAAHEILSNSNVPHEFFIDTSVPNKLEVLGTRILTIKK